MKPVFCLRLPNFHVRAVQFFSKGSAPVVIVSGRRVIACCEECRRSGIKPGMQAERAPSLRPDADVRVRDKALEDVVWEEVLRMLNGITPFMESPEESIAYFRTDDKTGVKKLASHLRACVGIAPVRSLSLLAAVHADPGSIFVVTGDEVLDFLDGFGVDRLLEIGFDEECIEGLRLFGYRTLGLVAPLTLRQLRGQFGEEGARLHALLNPVDEPPIHLHHPPPAIIETHDFDDPVSEPGDVLPALSRLVARAVTRLGAFRCRRISIHLDMHRSRERRSTSRILSKPSAAPQQVYEQARTLAMRLLEARNEIVSIKLELGGLRTADVEQRSLFFTRPSVKKTIKSIHEKYPNALLHAECAPDAIFEEDRVRFESLHT